MAIHEVAAEPLYKSYSFLTGTWYEVHVPVSIEMDPEDIYDKYWDGELPEEVQVIECDVSHIWDDELMGNYSIEQLEAEIARRKKILEM